MQQNSLGPTVVARLAVGVADIDHAGASENPDLFCHRLSSGKLERSIEVVLKPGADKVAKVRLEFLPSMTVAD
ncbi:hypothetical protein H8M03_04060 [Sphingomonas sabuli]|uniref:Uncharacterized protein n=1 Tax=Sphingomonas sabuli TaxID=2764186 RepID=A0A7G9L4G6_9SPHN|nr:hypothetical protein [Sphingomonas sabuli]QNM83515.1 hypothetical protein H8M03_04060 [Sphingomonas sabuli]